MRLSNWKCPTSNRHSNICEYLLFCYCNQIPDKWLKGGPGSFWLRTYQTGKLLEQVVPCQCKNRWAMCSTLRPEKAEKWEGQHSSAFLPFPLYSVRNSWAGAAHISFPSLGKPLRRSPPFQALSTCVFW